MTFTRNSPTCKNCGGTRHSAFNCPRWARKPLQTKSQLRPKKRMKRVGGVTRKWLETRDKWLEQNKAPYYFCYYCNKMMTRGELTLDHYESRGRRPDLRFSLKNLVPCCYPCNSAKGSLSGDEYLANLRKE